MQKYDIILFDADDTLLDFKRSEREAIKSTLSHFGLPRGEEIVQAYSRINLSLWKKLERRETDKKTLRTERFVLLCSEFGFFADPFKMADFYASALSKQSFTVDGAIDICSRLFKSCNLYIITNGIKSIQTSRVKGSGLLPYIRKYFISEDIGFEKPDRRFFEAVAASVDGFDASRTLIVGDSLTSDIAGGINYGIDTCYYDPDGRGGSGMTYTVKALSEIEKIIFGGK